MFMIVPIMFIMSIISIIVSIMSIIVLISHKKTSLQLVFGAADTESFLPNGEPRFGLGQVPQHLHFRHSDDEDPLHAR